MYAGERLGAEWSRRLQGCGLAQLRCARTAAFQGIVHSIGSQALNTAILIWSVYRCVDGQLSTGDLMFLMVTSSGLSSALLASLAAVTGLRSMRPQLERVDELLKDARNSAPLGAPPMLTSNRISLKGASYRYGHDGRWVLDNRDWELERGAVVRLDSPSGSGKTTLLRMIAGLLPASQGQVSVFGIEAERARHLVLYVPQHCKLFEASIRENLELLSGAGRDDILRVAELTGLNRLLAKLPMGEETLVSADGQNLSSGQRQLVVLTAAFASARPIVLLDEATSQVDAETRAACRWDRLFAGRTVVYVEHG
jgi:ATP-binding cassette subfamily C protein LapB